MGILERLGLGRKAGRRPSRVGLHLSTVKPKPGRRLSRREVLVRAALFGALLALTALAFPDLERYDQASQIQPGDVWQRQEVMAPFRFAVYKSEEQIAAERDSVRYEEPPLFERVPDAAEQTEVALDSLDQRLGTFFQTYVGWQQNRARGRAEAARRDSAQYFSRLEALQGWLSTAQIEQLLASYAARAGLTTSSRDEASGPALHDLLLRSVRTVSTRLLPFGVLDVPKDSILTEQITVVNPEERTEVLIPKADLYGSNEALTTIRNELSLRYPDRPDAVALGVEMYRQTVRTSLRYLAGESEARWAEQAQGVSEVFGFVQEGESIVRRGDQVTEEVKRKLSSLARIRATQQGNVGPFQIVLGEVLLSLAAFLIFFLYLFLMRRQVFYEVRYLLLIALIFGTIIGFFGVAVRLPEIADLAVPVGLASILLTVIFDSRVGMFATITLACIGGLVFGFNYEFTFATIFAGMLAVFSMRDVKNRSQIILTAALVFGAYTLILGGYFLLRAGGTDRLFSELLLVAINSGLLLLAYPLLWIFERTFGVTTDLTLLELSDTNRPLLKELSLRAPGTFNHVLQVANLAEAAAASVGANALQARVGALYHDIGKMIKPEYYIENQQAGENPHDRVTPYMSALVIASHVKDGLDLAQQENLPEVVQNFIPTHHGTTLMEFFYRKAEELRGPDDPPVDEMEFRYPGPRPQTNEQGIVMLADSVEAASRSLDKPTPKRLEGLVDAIFKARIEDGQLDGCALTFADLNQIKETFLSILNGIYHLRVKYPDQEKITGEKKEETVPAPTPPAPPPASAPPGPAGEVEVPPRAQDVPAPAPEARKARREHGPSSEERASLG